MAQYENALGIKDSKSGRIRDLDRPPREADVSFPLEIPKHPGDDLSGGSQVSSDFHA